MAETRDGDYTNDFQEAMNGNDLTKAELKTVSPGGKSIAIGGADFAALFRKPEPISEEEYHKRRGEWDASYRGEAGK